MGEEGIDLFALLVYFLYIQAQYYDMLMKRTWRWFQQCIVGLTQIVNTSIVVGFVKR
jgi:hypothetical protein